MAWHKLCILLPFLFYNIPTHFPMPNKMAKYLEYMKKFLSITNYQGNTNQSHTRYHLHPS